MEKPPPPRRLAILADDENVRSYLAVAARLKRVCLTAVVDSQLERGRHRAMRLGDAIHATHLSRLLQDHAAQFDAVLVCGGRETRMSDCQAIAAAGKGLVIESPLAFRTEDAEQLLRDDSVPAAVGLRVVRPHRYLPAAAAIKGQLDNGKLGSPGLVRIHRWAAPPDPEAIAGPGAIPAWADSLLADLDLACWLFETAPNRVFAVRFGGQLNDADTAPPPRRSPAAGEGLQVHLGFPDGGMALIDLSHTPGESGYYSLSLIGARGAAYADQHRDAQLIVSSPSWQAVKTPPGVAHYAAMLDDCFAGPMSEANSGDSMMLRLAESVFESAATSDSVAIPLR